MSDPYLTFISQHWEDIGNIYNQFAEHHPIVLVDAGAGEIHALPYADFVDKLDAASQAQVVEQYHRAVASRQMVLFVRDADRKVFQSYTLQLEDGPPVSSET